MSQSRESMLNGVAKFYLLLVLLFLYVPIFTMAAICAFPCHIVMIVVYRIILWVCGSPDAAAIDHFITASVSAATIVFSLVASQWQGELFSYSKSH